MLGPRCLQCAKAESKATASPLAPHAATAVTRGIVSRANRKVCTVCGADVTFATKHRQPDGSFICDACAAGPAPAVAPTPEPKEKAKAQRPRQLPSSPRHSRLKVTPAKVAATAVFLALLIIASATWFILTPSWDEENAPRLNQMKEEAEQLLASKRPKESYYKFQQLFAAVGDRRVRDEYLRKDLDVARSLMDRAYREAKPIIDKEREEEKARLARQQEQERQRKAAQAAAREHRAREQREQEQARREQERQARRLILR
jgi:hypothetical protein